jgi:hypothetical protein
MDSFSSFKFMPLPHLNTLPLQRQKPRSAYLITQRLNNFFVALECDRCYYRAWEMTTGQAVTQEKDIVPAFLDAENKELHIQDKVPGAVKDLLAGYKVWSGVKADYRQDTAGPQNSKEIEGKFQADQQGSIRNQPKIYLQNQLDYTILWKKGRTEQSAFVTKDYQQLKVSEKRSEYSLKVVSLQLEEKSSEKILVPSVKVHFALEWSCISETATDLFFAPWTDSDPEIKMLEIAHN